MFSSPAFGSFTSPSFQSNGVTGKGLYSSDPESDDDDGEFEEDVDFLSGKPGVSKWRHNLDSFSLDDSTENTLEESSGDIYGNVDSPPLQHRQQKLLLRFNCADSLDRTNLASFFVALQFVGVS